MCETKGLLFAGAFGFCAKKLVKLTPGVNINKCLRGFPCKQNENPFFGKKFDNLNLKFGVLIVGEIVQRIFGESN